MDLDRASKGEGTGLADVWEEGREMPRTSLRFPFGRLSGRGTTAGEFEDQGVRSGADSRHSHTNLIRVPERAMSGSKERSCDKGLWGH